MVEEVPPGGKISAEDELPGPSRGPCTCTWSKENKTREHLGKVFTCKEDCKGIFRL